MSVVTKYTGLVNEVRVKLKNWNEKVDDKRRIKEIFIWQNSKLLLVTKHLFSF